MWKPVLTVAFACGCAVLTFDGATLSAQSAAPRVAAAPASSGQSFVNTYCATCHNARLKTGGLALDTLDGERVATHPDIWEKVVKKLRAGVMPPAGMPRPDAPTYQAFITSLEAALDKAADAAPTPGRPAIHRLNRVEYTNAIRDLLTLDIDGRSLLPADDSGYGFDNIADVLTLSPGLLERYLLAAKKISRLAIGDPTTGPAATTYNVPYMIVVQDDRVSEQLPFGSRGGVAIRHYFPLDGEYEIVIRLQRNSLAIGHEVRGLDVENQIDVRLDRERLKLFTVGRRQYGVSSYTENEDTADAHLKARFHARAGVRTVGVTFHQDAWYVEGVGMSRLPVASDGYASGRKTELGYGRVNMGIDRVDITGPFDGVTPTASASRRRIFVCYPKSSKDEEPCARTILSTLARRAYRRPVGGPDIKPLMDLYGEGRREAGFDAGIQRGLIRILTALDFLFRLESDPASTSPGTVYRLSDLELASRLSFFVWSSIPDDELLDVASRNELSRQSVLERQTRRMLNDPRAAALLSNFFGQWLLVRNMSAVRPDTRAFPEFDENLREAFQRETELFLETQLREDRSVTELLSADYTFVNERLARHYGIPKVYGEHFRRVRLSDGARGGLLGHGSVLTVTSYPDRTSPVVRGKFLLDNILGTPPPPPPANVPPLEKTDVKGSLRQRMEQHRKNPVCATCHSQLDPLGFALENFDGIGKFRTTDAGVAVDASGTMPDGTAFDGPASFRQALMLHRDAFVTTLIEKLLTYALGRGLDHHDMPAVRAIKREAAAGEYRWSALILGIVKSLPFQFRSVES